MKEVPGVLLLYHAPFAGRASTIMEHVDAFGAYSAFPVSYVNTDLGFPRRLREFQFQAVVLHYSLFAPVGYYLDEAFLDYLALHRNAYRIAFFQDEHHYCQQRFAFLNDHSIDCVFTLIEPQHVSKVYGRYTQVPDVVYSLPGYVTTELEEMAARSSKPDHLREIDIGYRGRKLPAYMGRGGQEKFEIAREFHRRAAGRGLALDIEAEETRRIYGDGWFAFLENCRAVLGVESGVSIFDTDDAVRLAYERLIAERPDLDFEGVSAQILEPYENVIPYRTISPRHFEAAALGTCQILFEGSYSGLLRPMEHYIPLKKDFSNFEDVLLMFQDRELRTRLVQQVRYDLIESGAYSYREFIKMFDLHLKAAGVHADSTSFDRSIIDTALQEGHRGRQLRRHLRHARHREFPGRRLLKPLIKPLITHYSDRRSGRRPG
ncbi:MAG: hypothetical protein KC432_13420 [Thermomicrobiales bacterium]|nr:hypothetical protein [Thermomicrobiales bacterium]